MNIKTRNDACRVLGIPITASEDEIKNAYRTLSKQYHPDVVASDLSWQYYDIQAAYEFLQSNSMRVPGDKILGADDDIKRRYSQSKETSKAIKRARATEKQRKEDRMRELKETAEKLREEERAQERRREEITKEAMEHIRAIQMADVISKMLE